MEMGKTVTFKRSGGPGNGENDMSGLYPFSTTKKKKQKEEEEEEKEDRGSRSKNTETSFSPFSGPPLLLKLTFLSIFLIGPAVTSFFFHQKL